MKAGMAAARSWTRPSPPTPITFPPRSWNGVAAADDDLDHAGCSSPPPRWWRPTARRGRRRAAGRSPGAGRRSRPRQPRAGDAGSSGADRRRLLDLDLGRWKRAAWSPGATPRRSRRSATASEYDAWRRSSGVRRSAGSLETTTNDRSGPGLRSITSAALRSPLVDGLAGGRLVRAGRHLEVLVCRRWRWR